MNALKLSVVINTKNSASTLESCLRSVRSLANEIIVMDMHSTDKTVELAKLFKAKVFTHPDVGYVEPARNAAIAKATGDWILILDADEEIPETLATHLETLLPETSADAYFVPRKNIIFGSWTKGGWWPDYLLRLFRAGTVSWSDEIHSVPDVQGKTEYLPEDERYAIIHHNYHSIDAFIDRAQRYGEIAAEKKRLTADPGDALTAWADEFLRRYYAWHGKDDGRKGFMLSLLQASAEVITHAKVWEKSGYLSGPAPQDLTRSFAKLAKDVRYWERKWQHDHSSGLRKLWLRLCLRLGW